MHDVFYNGLMEGCQLKYILKAVNNKGKGSDEHILLLLVKQIFLKSRSLV